MPIVNLTLLLGEFDGSKVTPTLVPPLVNLGGRGGEEDFEKFKNSKYVRPIKPMTHHVICVGKWDVHLVVAITTP
jgi:hypothetical protein